MDELERWAKNGFPEGAGTLILGHAARSFSSTGQFPETPNHQLFRLLWNGKTAVAGADVEALFPRLDEEGRASAIRLLAELDTRSASESLARILSLCASADLPKVGWPLLLPLERRPRDPEVLIPPMLSLVDKSEGAHPVHATLLAYAMAGMITRGQASACADIVARQASRAIDDLHGRVAEHGLGSRWDDDYVSVKTDVGLLLDLLGQLDQSRTTSIFEDAIGESEPWVQLWGALGLIRCGRSVAPEVFRQVGGWPDCRTALARGLESLERSDLFPDDFKNQSSLAEAVMVDWLLFPTELGPAPDEIRQLQAVAVETDRGVADLYVFAFRTHPPHWLASKDWVVGIAGPFLVSDQPTLQSLGATFSRFETLSEKPLSEHVEALFASQGVSG